MYSCCQKLCTPSYQLLCIVTYRLHQSKYVSNTERIVFVNKDIRDFQYGLTLNVGYNTFNIHIYYALSSLFNDGIIVQSGEAIEYKPLKVGLIFYIL